MNFLEKIKTGRLFSRGNKQEEKGLIPAGPATIIKFFFMDKVYMVEDFDLKFRQDMNERENKPGSLPYGGIISITLSDIPDYTINEWMMQTYLLRDGVIRFFSNKSKVADSALLSISFSDGYCVNYDKKMNIKHGVLTSLVISPRVVKIGDEEFENKWNMQDTNTFYIKSI